MLISNVSIIFCAKKRKLKKAGQQMKNGRHNFKSASVCEFEKYSGKYMKKYKRNNLNG